MPTSSELARRLLDEGGPVYGFYPHLNPRVPNKPDTLNTPEHRSALAEGLLSVAPGSGEAMSARDAWNASGRGAQALGEGRWGDAASAYGDMALGTLGAIPGAGYIARGTKKGAAWMDRNIPAWVNRLLDAAAPKGAQNTVGSFAGGAPTPWVGWRHDDIADEFAERMAKDRRENPFEATPEFQTELRSQAKAELSRPPKPTAEGLTYAGEPVDWASTDPGFMASRAWLANAQGDIARAQQMVLDEIKKARTPEEYEHLALAFRSLDKWTR